MHEVLHMHHEFDLGRGRGGYSGIVLAYWSTGQAINPAPGALFITKFISLAQVVPGPV